MKFITKVEVVDAIQWLGNNRKAVELFIGEEDLGNPYKCNFELSDCYKGYWVVRRGVGSGHYYSIISLALFSQKYEKIEESRSCREAERMTLALREIHGWCDRHGKHPDFSELTWTELEASQKEWK